MKSAWNRSLSSRNKSGVTGVTWHKSLNKWQVHIQEGGKSVYLGSFTTVQEAIDARRAAEIRIYGHKFKPSEPRGEAPVSKTGLAGSAPAGGAQVTARFDRKSYVRDYNAKWIRKRRSEWFSGHGPCVRCQSYDNLQLDHIDPSTKISHRIWSWSAERRDLELAKCQVLCRECHRAKTIAERQTDHGTIGRYDNGCRCDNCKSEKLRRDRLKRERERNQESLARRRS